MEEEKTENRFFAWMRATGIERQNGWIGGIAAGIGVKLGIDPLIVRGILVVTGLLGAPALFVYALAWLLLPDKNDNIHLEQLMRGRFSPAIAGIGAMLLISLLPLSGFVPYEFSYWRFPLNLVSGGLWTLIVIGSLIAFVVWVAHRVRQQKPKTEAETDAASARVTPTEVTPEPDAAEPEPSEPDADASTEEFDAWRIKQAEWKKRNEQYRAEAATFEPSGRGSRHHGMSAQLQTDYEALRRAEAARRAARQRANPRLSAAWVFVVVGAALVASAIGALVASVDTAFTGSVGLAGVATAAVVVGVAIVIAGAARRRSGFLSFVAIVLVVFAVPLAALPADRELIAAADIREPGNYAQVSSFSYINVRPGMTGTIDIWQAAGEVQIYFSEGTGAHIESTMLSGAFYADQMIENEVYGAQPVAPTATEGGTDMYSKDYGDPDQDLTIRLWQGAGTTWVNFSALTDIPGYEPGPTPTPTESPE